MRKAWHNTKHCERCGATFEAFDKLFKVAARPSRESVNVDGTLLIDRCIECEPPQRPIREAVDGSYAGRLGSTASEASRSWSHNGHFPCVESKPRIVRPVEKRYRVAAY